MKRLLPQIGLTYLSVLAVVFYSGKQFAYCLGAAAFVLSVAFLVISKYRKTLYLPVVSVVTLLSCVVFVVYTNFVYDKIVDKYSEAEGVVVAQLVEEPQEYSYSKLYKFRAEEFNGEKCRFKFYTITDDNIDIEPFEKIKMQVRFERSYSNNDKSNGYFLKTSHSVPIDNYTVYKSEHRNLYYHAIKLRSSIRDVMDVNLNKEAADLCNALLIGDKYSLSADIKEDFVRSGASHLIVVSGFHFSVLASVFYHISRRLKGKKILAAIPAVVFIIIYMLVTGCTPSVLRSAVMMLLCYLGLSVFRDTSPHNSLSIAAVVVLLLFGPYSAGNLSLILSFACTFSIIEFSPKINSIFSKRINKLISEPKNRFFELLKKLLLYIGSAISINISAYIASFPLSVIFFSAFSSISIISTLLLSLPVQALLVLSLVFSLCSFVPVLSLLIPLLSYPIEILSSLIIGFVKFLSSLEFSYVYIRESYIYILIILSFVLLGLMYINKSKHRTLLTVMLILLAFVSGELSSTLMKINQKEELCFYGVGDGIAVVYGCKDTTAVLMLDCNGEGRRYVVDKVEKSSIDVDFYACTNNTTSAMRSLYSFTQAFAIDDILLYNNKTTITIPDTVGNVHTPAYVYTVTLSQNVFADYCYIGEQYVIYLKMYDKTMLILPYMFDAQMLPQHMREADYIAVNGITENFDVLSCDTLIVSAHKDKSQRIMKYMNGIYDKVYLTSDGDVRVSAGGVD